MKDYFENSGFMFAFAQNGAGLFFVGK